MEHRMRAGRRFVSGAAVALLLVAGAWGTPSAGAVTAGVSHLTPDQAYVASAYHDFLGRVPHGVEWDAIENDLTTPETRGQFVGNLAMTPEWVTRTVQRLYTDTLGRDGDQAGVDYWVGKIRTKQLTVAQVAAFMYSSKEYFDGFGNGVVRTWVLDLYTKILLRSGASDPSGVDYWVKMTAKVGRKNVAYAFFQSNESRHTRVENLYETLLGRSPVGDQAGWDYWANVITTRGDLALASALAASDEYYARATVQYANAGPGNWGLNNVGGDNSLIGNIALGPDEIGEDGVVCSVPCTHPTLLAGLAGYTQVQPVGATSTGVIVGSAIDPDGLFVGLVWANAAAAPTLLAAPHGSSDVLVSAVGASGVVVGSAVDAFGVEVPYFWSSPAAQPTALAAPTSALGSWAVGISPTGVIFGSSISGDINSDAAPTYSALVWTTTAAAPTVLSAPSNIAFIQLTAMSASGVVIGVGFAADDSSADALAWTTPTSQPSVLKEQSGAAFAIPIAISSTGRILGVQYTASASSDVVLSPITWATTGAIPTTMQLPTGYTGGVAIGYLASGEIVGDGFDALGDSHILVWNSPSATPTVLPDVS
jgi:hypothetical protein